MGIPRGMLRNFMESLCFAAAELINFFFVLIGFSCLEMVIAKISHSIFNEYFTNRVKLFNLKGQ